MFRLQSRRARLRQNACRLDGQLARRGSAAAQLSMPSTHAVWHCLQIFGSRALTVASEPTIVVRIA
jgi:hypothetical protein